MSASPAEPSTGPVESLPGSRHTVVVDPAKNRVHAILRGALGIRDVGPAMKRIVEHPEWRPHMDILLDLSGARLGFEGLTEIHTVIMIWRADLQKLGRGRNAFVSSDAGARAIARIVQIAGSPISGRKGRVFATEAEAAMWLDEGPRVP